MHFFNSKKFGVQRHRAIPYYELGRCTPNFWGVAMHFFFLSPSNPPGFFLATKTNIGYQISSNENWLPIRHFRPV
jgi:hypothetical protein